MQRSLRFATLALLALTMVVGTAYAGSGSNNSSQNHTQALIHQYQKKSQKLQKIHQKTLKNNSSLKKEQNNYQQMLQSAVKKQGYNMKAGRQKLQALSKKLRSGNLNKSKRKKVMQQFQSERKKMTNARQKAMSQPKIKKARQKLQKDTLSAMNKQNPKTKSLINSLRNIQKQMRNSMHKGKQQHSG